MTRPDPMMAALVVLFATGACGAPGSACADRTGGAEVTIGVTGETFAFWTEDDAFVDGAITHQDDGTTQVAMFEDLLEGADCDDQWSFQVGPTMSWVDVAIELCDGRPSDVEGDLDYWIGTVGQWCPWGPVVTAVDDRR